MATNYNDTERMLMGLWQPPDPTKLRIATPEETTGYKYDINQAKAEAEKTGGIIDVDPKTGKFAVLDTGTPRSEDDYWTLGIPMGNEKASSFFPWETPTGEGFIAPWSKQVEYPGGLMGQQQAYFSEQAKALLTQAGYPGASNLPTRQFSSPEASGDTINSILRELTGANEPANPNDPFANLGGVGQYSQVITEPAGYGYVTLYGVDENGNKTYIDTVPDQTQNRQPTLYPEQGGGRNVPEGYYYNQYTGQYERLPWNQGTPDPYEEAQMRSLEAQLGLSRDQFSWQKQYQQQQLALQQQELEMQRMAHEAELRANPASWLEYAAYKNQAPVVQAWQLPLMQEQYGIKSVGEVLPTNYSDLPELKSPSAQYFNRIAPSSQQQYYGYEKARTGATPEDTQWRLWSRSAPGGTNRNLIQ